MIENVAPFVIDKKDTKNINNAYGIFRTAMSDLCALHVQEAVREKDNGHVGVSSAINNC